MEKSNFKTFRTVYLLSNDVANITLIPYFVSELYMVNSNSWRYIFNDKNI